jgi:hypothetical protein
VKLRLKPTRNPVELREAVGLRRSFTDDVGPDVVIGVLVRSTIIDLPAKEDLMTPNIETIIKDHVTLTVRCLDRIYLQGYMPKLQTSGGLCYFLRNHLGHPIPSPALFRPMHDRFVAAIKTFAADHAVPLVEFERGQDKDAIVATHRARFGGADGVVVIGVAQEKARAFKAHKRTGPQGGVTFDFTRQSVAVNHYYFYVHDPEWGPGFVKIGTYVPYPIKLCLNGHEWVKQQLRRARIAFTSLDNGFLTCADPPRLQAICDQLGPRDLQQFFDRWSQRLPWPLRPEDRAAGFDHRVTICQLEISLTQIFDRPVQGRHFFEAVIRENLDLGRPDRVRLLFPRRLTRRTPPPAYGYRTRIITDGVEPSLHIEYKHSHLKQYFKEGHGLRSELTVNNPNDFAFTKGLEQLPALRALGDDVNRTLLNVERVSQHCTLTTDALDRVQRPLRLGAARVAALRFGDPRVHALCEALSAFAHLPAGFRHRDLRPRVAALLGRAYSAAQMTYDLRRLRLRGFIQRLTGTHRYRLTSAGLRVAFFYSKLYLRIFRPHGQALESTADPIPRPLRTAFDRLDLAIARIYQEANLAA